MERTIEIDKIKLSAFKGFSSGSDGKESICCVGDSRSPGQENPLEKGMAIHSSILAWRIPWTEEPGWPQSMGSQRVRHDWETHTSRMGSKLHLFLCVWTNMHSVYLEGACSQNVELSWSSSLSPLVEKLGKPHPHHATHTAEVPWAWCQKPESSPLPVSALRKHWIFNRQLLFCYFGCLHKDTTEIQYS